MKINLYLSLVNGNMEGEIYFELVSGEDRQTFKRSWTVINIGGYREGKESDMRLECVKALIEVRLKELMKYLERQVEDGVITVNGKLKPLRWDWRIE